jgi:dihydrofolate reductase
MAVNGTHHAAQQTRPHLVWICAPRRLTSPGPAILLLSNCSPEQFYYGESMKVTLMMVMSADGKTTDGDKPGAGAWASPEDQKVFMAELDAHDCIVMGSTTYEAARTFIRPGAKTPRIILTRKPQKYLSEQRPGLDFFNLTPQEVVRRAEEAGHKSLLLVGGSKTNARFLRTQVVDELLLTVEPLILGAGTPLVAPTGQKIKLTLLETRQLNPQGTLLLRYRILKG